MFKLVLEKAAEPEIKLPTFIGSWRNQGSYRKNNIYFCFTDYAKVFDSVYKNKQNTTNKASGCDGIPVELFQILTDDAVKVLHSICQQIKLSSGHRTGKDQFSFQSLRKAMPKNAQTTVQLHSSHTLAKITP